MASSPAKISVILVTYNRAHYLPRSLGSVLSQWFSDYEVVLVNNGSTDGTAALCRQYIQEDPRIKLIDIPRNNGAPQGRNAGLDAATCEYVTIVDDDDCCEPGMLEHLWGLTSKYGADIAMCGSWNDFGDRLEPYFIFDEQLVLDKVRGLDELLKREKYNVAPPTKLFRKSLFDGIRFIDGVLVDDIHVIYKIFAKTDRVVAQGKPLYRFTKHDGNMTGFIHTHKLSPALLSEYLAMYCDRTIYLAEKVPEIYPRARYSEWSFMISMCDKITTYDLIDCRDYYTFMLEVLRDNYTEFWNSPFTSAKEKALLQLHLPDAVSSS